VTCQAILVNYHCADLICGAAHSLGGGDGLHVNVVDNSVSDDQAALLRACLPDDVRLFFPEKNLGFGQACNLAFEADESEFVLLLNPDARLLPGALATMISTLRSDATLAAVGPRVYWDESKRFVMPLSTFPSAFWYLRSCFGGLLPILHRLAARDFRRTALSAWRASRPFYVDALSGGHVLLRRSAVLAAGGLFDPDFFMYWEDSDLMHRLMARGYRLAQDPRAEALHLYSHSPAKEVMIQAGWPVYLRKHFDSLFWRLIAGLRHKIGGTPAVAGGFVPLAWTSGDICLDVPDTLDGWLLEISPAPDFVPAIGRLGSERSVTIPAELLRSFAGCDVCFRLSSASPDMRGLRTWVLKVPESLAETS
jgi:GT2 family glycosyltransferase